MHEFSVSGVFQVIRYSYPAMIVSSRGMFTAPRKFMEMDAGYGAQSIPAENSPKSKDIW
jgi:hypothetical protein